MKRQEGSCAPDGGRRTEDGYGAVLLTGDGGSAGLKIMSFFPLSSSGQSVIIPLMTESQPITLDLIAACGMNCAVCSKYLAYVHQLNRPQCPGCRPRNAPCTYLFEKCAGLNQGPTAQAGFCFECEQYPCPGIERMDKRYRENYGMSVIANLDQIREVGLDTFLEDQYNQHRCPTCGGLISVHNRRCFKCDTITRLVEKRNTER